MLLTTEQHWEGRGCVEESSPSSDTCFIWAVSHHDKPLSSSDPKPRLLFWTLMKRLLRDWSCLWPSQNVIMDCRLCASWYQVAAPRTQHQGYSPTHDLPGVCTRLQQHWITRAELCSSPGPKSRKVYWPHPVCAHCRYPTHLLRVGVVVLVGVRLKLKNHHLVPFQVPPTLRQIQIIGLSSYKWLYVPISAPHPADCYCYVAPYEQRESFARTTWLPAVRVDDNDVFRQTVMCDIGAKNSSQLMCVDRTRKRPHQWVSAT